VSIIFEYPQWFIVFCVMVAVAYAMLLYYRNKKNSGLPFWAVRVAFAARLIAVFIICFLLLSPLLKSLMKTLEPPLVVLIHDNSESVILNKDSVFYKGAHLKNWKELITSLETDYEVVEYTIGSSFESSNSIRFNEKETNLDDALRNVVNLYSGRNLGAVVMASDGIYNKGVNPLYGIKNIKAPIFTVALGDTSTKKDLLISRLNTNRIAYLKNKFPVEVFVHADKLAGKGSKLTISHQGNTVFSQDFTVNSGRFDESISTYLEATAPGVQHYIVKLSPIEGEDNVQNNIANLYIEVIDARKKVLILGDGPHPDAGAIRLALNENENYEAELKDLSAAPSDLKAYSLIILNQIPSVTNLGSDMVDRVNKSGIPVLYILGAASNLNVFNNLNTGLKILGNNSKLDDVKLKLNPNFTLFTLSEPTKNFLQKAGPVFSPYGNYEKSAGTEALFYRKIGNVETETPGILFSKRSDQKVAVITAEGLWRWRLADYAETGTHEHFDEMISKLVQYLAVSEDKSKFRINAKNVYSENEAVIIDAELYNNSYEPVNDAEVQIAVTASDKKEYKYTFSKTEKAYVLNAGMLPPGTYSYKASVNYSGEQMSKTGNFTIAKIDLEAQNTRADHDLMYQIAKQSGGEMFYPNTMNTIAERIKNREDVKPISYSEKQLNDFINFKALFFVLLALLSIEWFLRKWNGMF
jgi:hypothetical protein